MERMRPDYERVFRDMDIDRREDQLLDWARENIVERVLIRQCARADPRKIPKRDIDRKYHSLRKQYKDDDALLRAMGRPLHDIAGIQQEIELQFRVERLTDELTRDVEKPGEDELKKYHESRKDANDPQKPFEEVRSDIADAMMEERRNSRIETLVDTLKQKAAVVFETDDILDAEVARSKYRQKIEKGRYPRPLTHLLVKPAGPDCNMACTYCFYLEKAGLYPEDTMHRMRDETLREMIRQAMVQSRGRMGFGWQGGEPTLMGLDFFRKAVEYQKRYGRGHTVGNSLQTNGLLIDSAWADFLSRNRFLVGVSLDGPEHIHDHYRRLKGGGKTWSVVVENTKRMLAKGVAVNALTVITAYSAGYPEEIYHFHKDLGIEYMQFIPCMERDRNDPSKAAPFSVTPDLWGSFLCTLFDLWQADFKNGRPATSVRYFDSLFHTYVGMAPPECTLLEECGIYEVVEHNGDVYACDFYVEPAWKLGNVHEDKLVELLNSDRQKAFGLQKKQVNPICLNCPWLVQCRSGCPRERCQDPLNRGLSAFCSAYKMFFNHADQRFRAMAALWKDGKPISGNRSS